jgi:hypothetical protein
MPRSRSTFPAAAVLSALLAWPGLGRAQDCGALPNPVYIPSTSNVQLLVRRVAPKLAVAPAPDRMTLVYQSAGSCSARAALQAGTMTGTAVYWTGVMNPDGTPEEKTCTLPANARPALAFADVTEATCTGGTPLPAGFAETSSIVEGIGFIVPPNSSQQAITAEEAFYLLRYGGEAGRQVAPWIDPQFVVVRTPASSTQLQIGLASGVLGTMWSANLTNSNRVSADVIAKVAAQNTTGNAEKTIGILASPQYDLNRDKVRMLAFKAFRQCIGAVFPDSAPTAFDKRNVRDGHYAIWGYLWSITRVDAQGVPIDPNARKLVSFLSGTTPLAGADPIVDVARVGGIPACAMEVQRAFDGAALEPYSHPTPCGCYFESVSGQTTCTACSATSPCATGTCRFGFCEKR